MPTTQASSRTLHVVQQGQFPYTGTAAAAAGTTYTDGVVSTGDTV
jgi:hypothetical protein